MIDPQLDGKVAVVTGANHGIGAATARRTSSVQALLRPDTSVPIAKLSGRRRRPFDELASQKTWRT